MDIKKLAELLGDHPRVGGEKPNHRLFRLPSAGSPPRGRGKVMLYADLEGRVGITPAWAGKSTFEEGVELEI